MISFAFLILAATAVVYGTELLDRNLAYRSPFIGISDVSTSISHSIRHGLILGCCSFLMTRVLFMLATSS